MRRLLKPLVCRLLRRDPDEIRRAAAGFRIHDDDGRELVHGVGQAFVGGFNAMLAATDARSVARKGSDVAVHFRPFFFEGAAMGYLPRGLWARDSTVGNAERDLLALDSSFRYLYYVGLGFWYGFRHSAKPRRIEDVASQVDALYRPLCYDGYGFQQGFFEFPGDAPRAVARFDRCPERRRRFAYQGFGRASFFVFMHDDAAFREMCRALPDAHRGDLECGRALAHAFTGIDRADRLVSFVEESRDERERSARLLGTTWALAARRMNDPAYFDRCLAIVEPGRRALLACLPDLCEDARAGSRDYEQWQQRTRDAVVVRWRE